MSIRYVTVDYQCNILEVSMLRDTFDRPTTDPALAERCIVRLPNGQLAAAVVDEGLPVYTVH